MKTFFFTTLALLTFSYFSAATVSAQSLPCGNIIGPMGVFNGDIVTKLISDCADPFKVTTNPASPYALIVEGQQYQNGAVIPVAGGQTDQITASGTPNQMFLAFQLFDTMVMITVTLI